MAGDHTGLGGLLAVLGWIFEKTNGQIELDTKLCLGTGRASDPKEMRRRRARRTPPP